MRYSNNAPIATSSIVPTSASNHEFFAAVRQAVKGELSCAVLLVGGVDERSLALRRAQATLRYDRLASYWSHAALVLHSADGDARGVEVSLEPADPAAQRPALNGVTTFSLTRYEDSARFPNVALFCVGFPTGHAKAEIVSAALHPNRDRTRYPLWDQLATWARYAYAPDAAPNPLLEGVPLPAASLCEYAFAAANIDLTPGATGNHACPEVLWATMKRWGLALEATADVALRGFTLLRDEVGTPAPQPLSLAEQLGISLPSAKPADSDATPSKTKDKPHKSKPKHS